jgi:hypothetical protein
MKIPFETILDFHAHGCPIGHEGLLFTYEAKKEAEIMADVLAVIVQRGE